MPDLARMARRQRRRRTIAGVAFTASAVSSARANRAARKRMEAEAEMMENAQQQAVLAQSVQDDSASTQSSAPAGDDLAAKLKQLKSLRDQDLITEEEYQAKKQQLLGI